MKSQQDPLWAVRLVKRTAKVLAGLILVLVFLGITWVLIPASPPILELRLSSTIDAFLGGSTLGRGEIVIEDQTLREHGVLVEEGTELQAIAGRLFPGEEFRGEFGHEPTTLPALATGVQCHLRSKSGWRVVRIFVFPVEKGQWLAVPVSFLDGKNGRVHTECPDWSNQFGWSLNRRLEKVPHHTKVAAVHSANRSPPGDGEITFASMAVLTD